ncbi:hypothetical protein VTK26DRAFT_4277 [Humicola hyalothermophila]
MPTRPPVAGPSTIHFLASKKSCVNIALPSLHHHPPHSSQHNPPNRLSQPTKPNFNSSILHSNFIRHTTYPSFPSLTTTTPLSFTLPPTTAPGIPPCHLLTLHPPHPLALVGHAPQPAQDLVPALLEHRHDPALARLPPQLLVPHFLEQLVQQALVVRIRADELHARSQQRGVVLRRRRSAQGGLTAVALFEGV